MPEMLQNDGISVRRNQSSRYSSKVMTPLTTELARAFRSLRMPTAMSAPISDALPSRPRLAELTLVEVIFDPLIAMMNEADQVDARSFAQLLQSASRVLYPGVRGTLASRTDSPLVKP